MSRLATPSDNARAESFMKTLKYEEVYRTEYRDLEEARALIKQLLEKLYNQQRLHSAPAIVRRWRSNAACDHCEPWKRDVDCAYGQEQN